MDTDDAELWSGAILLLIAAVSLVAPLALAFRYTMPLFLFAVVALAAGSVLVGLSRRGRAV